MNTLRFAISKPEIDRRARAFASLAITWPIALAYMALLPFCNQPNVALVFAATIAVAMAIIGATTIYFLYTRHLHTVFEIDDTKLSRIMPGHSYTYGLTSVTHMRIKRTSHGVIRQISLVGPNWRTNIDGLQANNFEDLSQLLADRCVNAKTTRSREPLNFDHVLFYPILGLLLATISYALIYAVFDNAVLNIALIVATGYGLGVAVYIAAARPLARQYGAKSQSADYLLAAAIAILAIAVIIMRLAT